MLLKIFILSNSADSDEMLPYVLFQLGLHCLPKYLFTCIQNEGPKMKKVKYFPVIHNKYCLLGHLLPHWRHCVVSLSKNINPSLVLVQPRKTRPFITERLLMGRKESNQTNKLAIC